AAVRGIAPAVAAGVRVVAGAATRVRRSRRSRRATVVAGTGTRGDRRPAVFVVRLGNRRDGRVPTAAGIMCPRHRRLSARCAYDGRRRGVVVVLELALLLDLALVLVLLVVVAVVLADNRTLVVVVALLDRVLTVVGNGRRRRLDRRRGRVVGPDF